MCGRLVQQGPGDGESEECSEHSIIQDIFPPKVRPLQSLNSVGPEYYDCLCPDVGGGGCAVAPERGHQGARQGGRGEWR